MRNIEQEIEKTGYANGERFDNEAEVRAYFTAGNMRAMFGADADWTQEQLDEMADYAVENWMHMVEPTLIGAPEGIGFDAFRELCTITTRDEAGRHFTEFSSHWKELEEAGLIEIGRPVHEATGISYSQEYWSVQVTEDGLAVVEANPELHPE